MTAAPISPMKNDRRYGRAHDDVMQPYANAVGSVPRSACAKLRIRFARWMSASPSATSAPSTPRTSPSPHTPTGMGNTASCTTMTASAGTYGADGAGVGRRPAATSHGWRLGSRSLGELVDRIVGTAVRRIDGEHRSP